MLGGVAELCVQTEWHCFLGSNEGQSPPTVLYIPTVRNMEIIESVAPLIHPRRVLQNVIQHMIIEFAL